MSILNKLLGNAQKATRGGGTYGRTARKPARGTSAQGAARGRGMAKRPATNRSRYGRTTTTSSGGLGGMISGLLRRR